MKILFIDDEIIRHNVFSNRWSKVPGSTVVGTTTVDQTKQLLEAYIQSDKDEKFDVISFDYDMYNSDSNSWGNMVMTAEWFIQNCPKDKLPKFFAVHSINPQGAWHLYHVLSVKAKVFLCPFRLENTEEYLLASECL